jgi:hypothetical protein
MPTTASETIILFDPLLCFTIAAAKFVRGSRYRSVAGKPIYDSILYIIFPSRRSYR